MDWAIIVLAYVGSLRDRCRSSIVDRGFAAASAALTRRGVVNVTLADVQFLRSAPTGYFNRITRRVVLHVRGAGDMERCDCKVASVLRFLAPEASIFVHAHDVLLSDKPQCFCFAVVALDTSKRFIVLLCTNLSQSLSTLSGVLEYLGRARRDGFDRKEQICILNLLKKKKLRKFYEYVGCLVQLLEESEMRHCEVQERVCVGSSTGTEDCGLPQSEDLYKPN